MSRQFWRGFCFAPWLLASSGCATVPFADSASTTPLPTDRRLAIAQTFERQGNTVQARKIYEQVLAAEPNSVVAGQRLETLIAKSDPPNGQNQKSAAPAIAKQHPLQSESGALASRPSIRTNDPNVAAQAKFQPASHHETTGSPTLDGAAKPSANPVDLPPSPTSAVAGQQISTPDAAQEEVWELPVKSSGSRQSLSMDIAEPATPDSAIRGEGVVDGITPELNHLFDEFDPSMLNEVHEHRAEWQDVLLAVATDPKIELRHRARAIFLLGHIGPDAIHGVSKLRQLMNSEPDALLRVEIAEAILKIQPDNEDAVRHLLDLLKSTDSDERWYAAFALRLSASAHPSYVELSIRRLLDSADQGDLRLRRMALLSLGAFGPAASIAIPTMTAALGDSDEMTRVIASTSLRLITQQPGSPSQSAVTSADTSTPAN